MITVPLKRVYVESHRRCWIILIILPTANIRVVHHRGIRRRPLCSALLDWRRLLCPVPLCSCPSSGILLPDQQEQKTRFFSMMVVLTLHVFRHRVHGQLMDYRFFQQRGALGLATRISPVIRHRLIVVTPNSFVGPKPTIGAVLILVGIRAHHKVMEEPEPTRICA